jgi:hypothetical protein
MPIIKFEDTYFIKTWRGRRPRHFRLKRVVNATWQRLDNHSQSAPALLRKWRTRSAAVAPFFEEVASALNACDRIKFEALP